MRIREVVVMKKKWNRVLTLMVMTAATMLALTACGGYQIETGRFCNDTHLYYQPWESDDEMETIMNTAGRVM